MNEKSKRLGLSQAAAAYILATTIYLAAASKIESLLWGTVLTWVVCFAVVAILNTHHTLWDKPNAFVDTQISYKPGLILTSVLLVLMAGVGSACHAGGNTTPFLVPGLLGLVLLFLTPRRMWKIRTSDRSWVSSQPK